MAEVCEVHEQHMDKILKVKKKLPSQEINLEVSDLMEDELCTCDLSNISNLSVSAVSHQLRILKDRKIVTYRKDGKNVFYRLSDNHIKDILKIALEHIKEDH